MSIYIILKTYYRQLVNRDVNVFSNIYEFIINKDIENQDEKIIKLLENSKKYLDKQNYFDALIILTGY